MHKSNGTDTHTYKFLDFSTYCLQPTGFVNDRYSNVEHYRCYHGIDPIKICHLLADCRVSLYIVGINCNGDRRTEDHFLSGITQITGGRYFEIHDIKHLRPVSIKVFVSCIPYQISRNLHGCYTTICSFSSYIIIWKKCDMILVL